jgi:coenzyme F420 hydrogenase subunit beta
MSIEELKRQVVDPALCAGCGACGLVCPKKLIDFDPDKVEPRLDFDPQACGSCNQCVEVCPGADPDTGRSEDRLFGRRRTPDERWLGIYREAFGARSSDDEVVRRSASGGTVTTLLLESKTRLGVEYVLTMGRSSDEGWRARGQVTGDAETVTQNAQSTYQLTPYLTALRDPFENHPTANVAVSGIACHMQAIRKLQRQDTPMGAWSRDRIVLLVEIACSSNTLPAGSSSIITDVLNVDRNDVVDIKFREGNYPGRVQVTRADRSVRSVEFWQTLKVLKEHKTHRCLTCGDWMSGLADISVCDGDPNIFDASLNGTIVAKHGRALVRTETGRALWSHCAEVGALESWPIALTGFNLGLERKRNRRRHYEISGVRLPAGPGVEDVYDGAELKTDDELIDPRRYQRESM